MSESIQCIIVDDEPVACEILEHHLAKINHFNIVATCKNAMEAFEVIKSNKIDLIFLDINMPDITGLSFAKLVAKNSKIIFTTAYREYAVDGFNLKALDYLLKPISFERLLQAISKYLDEHTSTKISEEKEIINENDDFIFVRSNRKMIKIKFTEIKFIESLSDYIQIHLEDKIITTRETITSIEAKLPQNDFLRVHRSFIVSIANIDSYTNETIGIGKKEIPLSRSYKNIVLDKLDSK